MPFQTIEHRPSGRRVSARVHYVAYRNVRSGAYVFAPPEDEPKELTYEEEGESAEATAKSVDNGFRWLPGAIFAMARRPAPNTKTNAEESAGSASRAGAPVVVVVRGPLLSEVHAFPARERASATRGPLHVVTRLYANAGERDALELETLVDLSPSRLDTDLALRIDTDLHSRGRFFTDQNCFAVHTVLCTHF